MPISTQDRFQFVPLRQCFPSLDSFPSVVSYGATLPFCLEWQHAVCVQSLCRAGQHHARTFGARARCVSGWELARSLSQVHPIPAASLARVKKEARDSSAMHSRQRWPARSIVEVHEVLALADAMEQEVIAAVTGAGVQKRGACRGHSFGATCVQHTDTRIRPKRS